MGVIDGLTDAARNDQHRHITQTFDNRSMVPVRRAKSPQEFGVQFVISLSRYSTHPAVRDSFRVSRSRLVGMNTEHRTSGPQHNASIDDGDSVDDRV